MRLNLMVEGQEGVTWPLWQALGAACEDHGLEGLFRSDHYLSILGEEGERGSLDAWSTLAALAAETSRVRLGALVSPGTFRHPSVLEKSVVTADHISGGRVELGIGAGWYEREHAAYGFPFADAGTRMSVLEEQVEIVHRQWSEKEVSLEGRHHRLDALRGRPGPVQDPHPPLIVGRRAGRRSAALAARWADEYNTVFSTRRMPRETGPGGGGLARGGPGPGRAPLLADDGVCRGAGCRRGGGAHRPGSPGQERGPHAGRVLTGESRLARGPGGRGGGAVQRAGVGRRGPGDAPASGS